MNVIRSRRAIFSLLIGSMSLIGAVGCQSTVGGQTMPSPDYLKDDVQYHRAGPEYILSQQKQALDEYRVSREAGADQFNAP